MDAFFESPKHGNTTASLLGNQERSENILETQEDKTQILNNVETTTNQNELVNEQIVDNNNVMDTSDIQFNNPTTTNSNSLTNNLDTNNQHNVLETTDQSETNIINENLLNEEQISSSTTNHELTCLTEHLEQQQQQQQQQQQHYHNQEEHEETGQPQLTELTNADMSSHVKLEMENGQVVVVDPSQIETVVLVTSTDVQSVGHNEINIVGNGSNVNVMSALNQDNTNIVVNNADIVDASLIATASLENDDSNQMEEDPNDTDIKEIDDTLAMSPGFNSLGGIGNASPFVLNGNNVSTHTFRKTEWDVKKLENYVRLSFGDATPMENMQSTLMNRYLVSFFKLAKKSDGMDYEPESLIGFMNSFERYLKTKNYPESLLRSETFKESRTELKKKRDLVRSIGKLIRTKTKDTCYLLQFHRNLLKEKGLLNRDNPDCLLAEIYLNNMIYFGEFLKEDKAWRGNLNLVWGDMLLERDTQTGQEYLTLATYAKKTSRNQQQQQQMQQQNNPPQIKTNSRTKTGTQTSKLRAAAAAAAAANSSGNLNMLPGSIDANSPRVYARQPSSYCPVEAYKMYRSRRPNNCLDRDSPFYLAPLFKSKNQSKVWYKALAMSCQRLDALFYCLFKKAGVDLASLASMSQQQQQQAVAAAASIINNTNGSNENQLIGIDNTTMNSSSLTQWKAVMKENNQLHEDVNELLLGNVKHVDVQNNNINNSGFNATNNNSINAHTAYYTTSNGAQTVSQSNQYHHIVTTVPAQVQVQVQVQVQLPQHQQQHLATLSAQNTNSSLHV